MGKRPWFPFYPGDWIRDAGLRSCPLEAQGLWANLLCIMHDCEPYGHLAVNGVPLTDAEVAPMVGLSVARYRKLLAMIESKRVSSRSDTGALYSRRMDRDEQVRQAGRVNGALGGNPALCQPHTQPPPLRGGLTPSVGVGDIVGPATANEVVVVVRGEGAGEGIAELLDSPYRDAYLGYRSQHPHPFGYDQSIRAQQNGMQGSWSWDVIGKALQDMAGRGIAPKDWSPKRLRNHCAGATAAPYGGPRLERRGTLREHEEARARATGEVA